MYIKIDRMESCLVDNNICVGPPNPTRLEPLSTPIILNLIVSDLCFAGLEAYNIYATG